MPGPDCVKPGTLGVIPKLMSIPREKLVSLCDDFLQGRIDAEVLQAFSEECIADDALNSESDEVVKDILYEWENSRQDIPITISNVALWKVRLETEVDRISYFNSWNYHISSQREICARYNSKWCPTDRRLFVGVSNDILSDPLNGLRHPQEGKGTGWFIWCGDYSSSEDFFKPFCAEHLLQVRPEVVKYLALEPGFRFQIDKAGYEDVWFDKRILLL